MAAPMPPRRKKWTEEEERTLIDKYEEMLSEGSLAKMKTREKKFRPIAAQVNSLHHARDPVVFPWQWTWKDASTKVQNMRHQYLLVKQKIKKTPASDSGGTDEDFDWVEGLTHWPNFLRYKDVFGDVALGLHETNSLSCNRDNGISYGERGSRERVLVLPTEDGGLADGFDVEEDGDLGLGLGFENEREDRSEENFDYDDGRPSSLFESRRKRKKLKGLEQRVLGFVTNQLARLESRTELEDERERAREERDRAREERERAREEREHAREEREHAQEKLRHERLREWEAMEKESVERERRRGEEELARLRELEERMERRRLEWKKRMDDMLTRHRATMYQLQSRILQDQQSVMNQLLGIVTQWTGASGMPDHAGTLNPYLSQMVQNLPHVNGTIHGENRVDGESHEDQFIVDG